MGLSAIITTGPDIRSLIALNILTVISRTKLFDGEILVGELLPIVDGSDDVKGFVELLVDGRPAPIRQRFHARVLTVAVHPVIARLDHVLQEKLSSGRLRKREKMEG